MRKSGERWWPFISAAAALLGGSLAWHTAPWRISTMLIVWLALMGANVRAWSQLGALQRRICRRENWRHGLLLFSNQAGARHDVFWQFRRAEGAAVSLLTAWMVCTHAALHLSSRRWGIAVIASLAAYGVLAARPAADLAKYLKREEPMPAWRRRLLVSAIRWLYRKSLQHHGCPRRREEMAAALKQLLQEERTTR